MSILDSDMDMVVQQSTGHSWAFVSISLTAVPFETRISVENRAQVVFICSDLDMQMSIGMSCTTRAPRCSSTNAPCTMHWQLAGSLSQLPDSGLVRTDSCYWSTIPRLGLGWPSLEPLPHIGVSSAWEPNSVLAAASTLSPRLPIVRSRLPGFRVPQLASPICA